MALPVVSTYCSLKNTMERDTVINIQCRRHSTLLRCHDTLRQYSIQDVSTSTQVLSVRRCTDTPRVPKNSVSKITMVQNKRNTSNISHKKHHHTLTMNERRLCMPKRGRKMEGCWQTSNSVVMSSQQREFLDVHVPEFRT